MCAFSLAANKFFLLTVAVEIFFRKGTHQFHILKLEVSSPAGQNEKLCHQDNRAYSSTIQEERRKVWFWIINKIDRLLTMYTFREKKNTTETLSNKLWYYVLWNQTWVGMHIFKLSFKGNEQSIWLFALTITVSKQELCLSKLKNKK